MRVLYVEDNPANVFLVKRVARMGNHEIINYIDGGQALKKFDELKPDLVLMDLQLSGDINGLEAVKMLRDRGIQTPIIAVTAYAMVGDRERCIEAGCTDYLAKPLPIQRLVEIFEHYDKETAAAPPAEAAVTAPAEPSAEPVSSTLPPVVVPEPVTVTDQPVTEPDQPATAAKPEPISAVQPSPTAPESGSSIAQESPTTEDVKPSETPSDSLSTSA